MEDLEKLSKNIYSFSKLASYRFIGIIFRIAFAFVTSVLIIQIVKYAASEDLQEQIVVDEYDYLTAFFTFLILGELLIIIDNIFERIWPIPVNLRFRALIQFILSLTITAFLLKMATTLTIESDFENQTQMPYFLSYAIGFVVVVFIISVLLIVRILTKWINDQERLNELQNEKMKMDYNALQDQLNPHFLFNNLSVLKSLIIYNKSSALQFTEKFTDVYRYVLQSKDVMLIEFKNELKFIESFIGIHKERFGDGLDVVVSIDKKYLNYKIAPLSLQLLVENAIKHNIVSKEQPLKLEIRTNNDYVVIKNSLQTKESTYSTNIGLNNLIKRYSMLTKYEVKIQKGKDYFKVEIPLLKNETDENSNN